MRHLHAAEGCDLKLVPEKHASAAQVRGIASPAPNTPRRKMIATSVLRIQGGSTMLRRVNFEVEQGSLPCVSLKRTFRVIPHSRLAPCRQD